MKVKDGQCRVAVVQAEPVMFDKKACLSKALSLLKKAAKGGANLVVFPELFIPGYPYGMNFGFSMGRRTADGRKDWKRYSDASLSEMPMLTYTPSFLASSFSTSVSSSPTTMDASE